MAFHVITPFSRPQNIERLVEHLRPFNIMWEPLCHEDTVFPDLWWIHPRVIIPPYEWMPTGAACYSKMNQFLDQGLFDQDAYMVLCDDDLLAADFFEKILPLESELAIVSMRLPDGSELIAAPQNCKPSRVGFEQMIISGRLFRQHRYENHCQADGRFIEHMVDRNREIVHYAPEAFVLWNALQ